MATPIHALEVRGAVSTVVDGATVSWDPTTFSGFYYDIDENLGNEMLDLTITDTNKLAETSGVKYTTFSQEARFELKDWGWYNSIAFLGENYFAGYNEKKAGANADIAPRLWEASEYKNALADEQLFKVLMDSDESTIIKPGMPLELAENYELTIKYIDEDGMFLELTKDGEVVDSKILSPSKTGATMLDKTYHYRKDVGDTKKLVLIGVYFKNALVIENQTMATVGGIWQISDTPIEVKADTEYGKMRISSVSENAIEMDNKDNAITLNKNKDTELMAGIHIKTADQDIVDVENPLRFYIYSEKPCECG
jgi:S-layer protein (TIGR01567 family)